MLSNLDRYKEDIDSLVAEGERLHLAIQAECVPEEFLAALRKVHGKNAKDILKALPKFHEAYQRWYSLTLHLVQKIGQVSSC